MRSQPDFAHFREPETVGVGESATDVAKGIGLMLAIIAFGFDMIGFFS